MSLLPLILALYFLLNQLKMTELLLILVSAVVGLQPKIDLNITLPSQNYRVLNILKSPIPYFLLSLGDNPSEALFLNGSVLHRQESGFFCGVQHQSLAFCELSSQGIRVTQQDQGKLKRQCFISNLKVFKEVRVRKSGLIFVRGSEDLSVYDHLCNFQLSKKISNQTRKLKFLLNKTILYSDSQILVYNDKFSKVNCPLFAPLKQLYVNSMSNIEFLVSDSEHRVYVYSVREECSISKVLRMPLFEQALFTKDNIVTCMNSTCFQLNIPSLIYSTYQTEGLISVTKQYGAFVFLECLQEQCKIMREVPKSVQTEWWTKVPWPIIITLIIFGFQMRNRPKKVFRR